MQRNALYETQSIHSGNMYQIYTDVKNRDVQKTGKVRGVLLYAKTEEEIVPNYTYEMDGNRISVKTLDLNSDFGEIKRQLDEIVQAVKK